MAFRQLSCVVAVCDLCGNVEDQDGGVPHHETEAEALDWVLSDQAQLPDVWYQRTNGQLVCWRRDTRHDEARESDGHYRPGPDAWGITFN